MRVAHIKVFKYFYAQFTQNNLDPKSPPFTEKTQTKTASLFPRSISPPQKRGGKRKKGEEEMLRNPTTSFLTATTLIDAIGAGITAAAGTRLALQLFLVWAFWVRLIPIVPVLPYFREHHKSAHCYLLSLPPCFRIGVICAPAAFLRSGCHLSGTLSGIEP